jgi:hypothetical protein
MSGPANHLAWVDLAEEDRALARDLLSGHAVEVRYPGGGVSAVEAKQAVEIAEDVRRAVRRELGMRV